MAKTSQDPKEISRQIVEDYKGLFGEDLVSIILYGSATGENYRPGKSDINFMIVLSEEGIGNIDRAFKTVHTWQKRKVAVPLFLTQGYIETSTDVFPIEYLNFQRNHVLVYGKDLLENLSFDHNNIRLQCEREIKGKLLVLRTAFLETGVKARKMKEVIAGSLQAFLAIFTALLFLREAEIPSGKREILRAVSDAYNLDPALFERVLDVKEDKIKLGDEEMRLLFKDYLKEVRRLSMIVDKLGG